MPNTDIVSGRRRRSYAILVTATTTGVRVLAADRSRVAWVPQAFLSTVAFYNPASVGAGAVNMDTASNHGFLWDVETFGDWVTGEIWAKATGGIDVTFRILIIVDPDVASQGV